MVNDVGSVSVNVPNEAGSLRHRASEKYSFSTNKVFLRMTEQKLACRIAKRYHSCTVVGNALSSENNGDRVESCPSDFKVDAADWNRLVDSDTVETCVGSKDVGS
jgi:hypothetical protein